MFDAGHGGNDIGTHDSGDDRPPERRQYTLKGVEAETIRLMRYAATKEGMKIGSWVSLRMKEAAERALSPDRETYSIAVEDNTRPNSQLVGDEIVQHMLQILQSHQELTERRFSLVERELHEITSSQRSILSALLAVKC